MQKNERSYSLKIGQFLENCLANVFEVRKPDNRAMFFFFLLSLLFSIFWKNDVLKGEKNLVVYFRFSLWVCGTFIRLSWFLQFHQWKRISSVEGFLKRIRSRAALYHKLNRGSDNKFHLYSSTCFIVESLFQTVEIFYHRMVGALWGVILKNVLLQIRKW